MEPVGPGGADQAPLAGLRVVDFSEAVPGPFFTRCLADLGASVVKVERPARDVTFTLQPAVWSALNDGKSIEVLDLKSEAGAARARELALAADVLVEGFRPGVMTRLGLGYEDLSSASPGLIYASLSGFGQTGPLAALPGHDLTYLAASGLLAVSGEQAPANAVGAPVGDLASSMYAVTATLAAVIQRSRTGRGQHLDVAIADCLVHWMNTVTPNLHARGRSTVEEARQLVLTKPAYGVFPTADGAWVAVAALEDKFWDALADELALTLDVPTRTRADRVAAAPAIATAIATAIAELEAEEVLGRLEARDVPIARVESPTAVPATAHARARGLFGAGGDEVVARFPVPLEGVGAPTPEAVAPR